MLFPVVSLSGGSYLPTPHTVATFFTSADAADFIAADGRTLFFGDIRYDRRTRGYRPAEQPSGYAEWCAKVDAEREARRAA